MVSLSNHILIYNNDMKEKFIKDSIYGLIKITDPFLEIIDTEAFQRLRHIKQLGLSYLVYPSANHSRLEHSLGCFYLSGKITDKFDFQHKNEFRIAALLHDIGHAPFSHVAENITKAFTQLTHEDFSKKIIGDAEIKNITDKYGLNTEKILDFISHKEVFGQLISSEIDVDRLDYLARDAYHTGVAYGVIDADLVIKAIEIKDGKIYCSGEQLPALESILIARYLMFPTVYTHHTVRIANLMFQDALYNLVSQGTIKAEEFISMTDADMLSLMKLHAESRVMITQIEKRNLYKMAMVFRKDDFNNLKRVYELKDDYKAIQEIQNALKRILSVQDGKVFIDIPEKPSFAKSNIIISEYNKPLEELSPLVKSLKAAEWNHWYVGIYCSKTEREKVSKAKDEIKKYLNSL